MNKYHGKILFSIILLSVIFLPSLILAQTGNPSGPTSNPGSVALDNPLGKDNTSIPQLVGQVINAVLGIVGSLALAMFIYGGFTWMIAAGSPERVQKGKDIILWATIGLIVIFTAYALVKLVIGALGGA